MLGNQNPAKPPSVPDLGGRRNAVGPAEVTAECLRGLLSDDPAAWRAATEHLDSAVVPGGRANEVTGVVARFVVGVLTSDQITDPDTVIELLYFLGQVTEAAEGDERESGVLACRQELAGILAAAEHCETSDREDVRTEAADAAEAAIEVMERFGIR